MDFFVQHHEGSFFDAYHLVNFYRASIVSEEPRIHRKGRFTSFSGSFQEHMQNLIPTGWSRRDTNLAGENSITEPAHEKMMDSLISFLSLNSVLGTQRM